MSIDSVHFSNISLRLLVILGLVLSSGCAVSEFLPGSASANVAQPEPVAAPGSDWTIAKIRAQEFAPWNMTQCV